MPHTILKAENTKINYSPQDPQTHTLVKKARMQIDNYSVLQCTVILFKKEKHYVVQEMV